MTAAALCSLPVGLSASSAAQAQTRTPLDIPAGTLSASLSLLSRQRGVSIGIEGRLPPFQTRAVRGDMPIARALARLLAGSGLDFERLAPDSFRLIRREPVRSPPARLDALPSTQPFADIIVTGNKRSQSLATLPLSVSVVTLPTNEPMAMAGSSAIAGRIEGLTLTNLGPGRNRQFIRGVADSPFNGATQSTVSIVVNDARVTYNAPDPDLRLVDVDRVEILKGPQGPLYGSGALGGVYHIITRPPDLARAGGSVSGGASAVTAGGVGGTLEAVLNLPLLSDRLGLRVVAYRARAPGWIDDGDHADSNDAKMSGGRIALRARPWAGWTIDLQGWAQYLNVADSQYVTNPGGRTRNHPIAEPHDNDFMMANAVVRGAVGTAQFLSSTSWVDHEVSSRFDASASAAAFGTSGPLLYDDNRRSSLLDQEFRLSRTDASGLSWLVGLSFIHATNHLNGLFSVPGGGAAPDGVATVQSVREAALFGEATLPLSPAFSATFGARLFRAWVENEGRTGAASQETSADQTGLSPSAALSWRVGADDFLYLRYAGARRPGGLSLVPGNVSTAYRTDELQTLDLGYRHGPGSAVSLETSTYVTRWQHVQADYLLDNGLVATRNAGDARIIGAELSVRYRPAPDWLLAAGGTAQRAHLIKPDFGLALGDDRRLPVVPDWTLRLEATRMFLLARWHGDVGAQINYTGQSRLSFDPGLDRLMGGTLLAGLHLAVQRDRWHARLSVDNLFDERTDSFAFGNPFSLRNSAQYTPMRPRQFSLAAGFAW